MLIGSCDHWAIACKQLDDMPFKGLTWTLGQTPTVWFIVVFIAYGTPTKPVLHRFWIGILLNQPAYERMFGIDVPVVFLNLLWVIGATLSLLNRCKWTFERKHRASKLHLVKVFVGIFRGT